MKINKIANNEQSFKGLYKDGLQDFYKYCVDKCEPELKKLGEKADLYIKVREYPKESFEFAVRKFGDKEPLRWSLIGSTVPKISDNSEKVEDPIIASIKKVMKDLKLL